MAEKRICSVDGCGKVVFCRGWCKMHYCRWQAHGDPEKLLTGAGLRWLEQHKNHAGDECLPWPFEVTRWGYGTVRHDGKRRPASRVMCILAHGEPPDETMDAAHSCGNRVCCNPQHLRWATRGENCADTAEHGRAYRGARHAWANLSEASIRAIRIMGQTRLQSEVAAEFGVHQSTVSRILARKRWPWLDG